MSFDFLFLGLNYSILGVRFKSGRDPCESDLKGSSKELKPNPGGNGSRAVGHQSGV